MAFAQGKRSSADNALAGYDEIAKGGEDIIKVTFLIIVYSSCSAIIGNKNVNFDKKRKKLGSYPHINPAPGS